MVGYLQRAAGYALTGSVGEHCLFLLYGTGRNGKSVFLDVLSTILGDYAATVDPNLLMDRWQDRHPTEVADLEGLRFVAMSEPGNHRQ